MRPALLAAVLAATGCQTTAEDRYLRLYPVSGAPVLVTVASLDETCATACGAVDLNDDPARTSLEAMLCRKVLVDAQEPSGKACACSL